MIKNVIFDVDGTLVDSNRQHAEAWQKAFAKFGKQIEFEAILKQIGKGGDQLMPVFLSAGELEEFGDELEDYRTKLFQKEYLPNVKAFPGVRELFRRIRQNGANVVLASSATDKDIEEFIKIMDVADFLQDTTSSDDSESSKPEPDIFLAALKKLGNPPRNECSVVGDTPFDAVAARKADLRIIGVTCGGWSANDLQQAGCVEVYQSPADLLEHFEDSLLGRNRAKTAPE